MIRYCCFIVVALMLSACQLNKSSLDHAVDDLLIRGGETFNMMNPYAVIRHDYKRGRIMRARARVLAMNKSSRDYKKAYKFFEEVIEPARRRVFLHYLHLAQKNEKQKHWSDALWSYDQAKAVTIKPAVMEKKRAEMEQRMRQFRFEQLLKQRRKEDRHLFGGTAAYEAPGGVRANDEIYERMRENFEAMLDARARLEFREALRYLSKDLPEIAYVELESYLRLQPDRIKGKKLMVSIKREMPVFLKIPGISERTHVGKKLIAVNRVRHVKAATAEQVQAALASGALLQAKQLAYIYQRNGGKGADKLLDQVQKKVRTAAASFFAKGSAAFRREQLGVAIGYWRDAAALAPEESEYIEALRRARQLQERLALLQEEK